HPGCERARHVQLARADLVRAYEHAPVAARLRQQRQADPGVAAGRLDDRAAGPERALLLGGGHHAQRDPVLDRPARVQIFDLGEHRGGRGRRHHPAQAHQRRIPDEIDDVVDIAHPRRLLRNRRTYSRVGWAGPAVGGYPLGVVWRGLRMLGYGAAAAGLASAASVGLLLGQVNQARREIPRAQAPPPRADGRYRARLGGEPLTMVMLGDSTAAGYGAAKPRQTPGALLATGVSRRLGRPVELHCLAVVGATSQRLAHQLEAALELEPQLAVIIIGANDVTHRNNPQAAVRHLVAAVRALRAIG